jgi:beta-RFAP synthase
MRSVGELAERGARSAIGMAAFETGGFVIDGGKGASGHAPPVLSRVAFPDAWRVLLILDPRTEGVSGDGEVKAFAALPPFPKAEAARLCHLALMRLLPGLAETDLVAFGDALTEIQAVVGGHFAAAQGGSPWTSAAVGRIAHRMKDLGAAGIGQSSWGPTGFAFTGSEAAAARLYATLVEEAKADGLEIRIVRGRNTGASLVPA